MKNFIKKVVESITRLEKKFVDTKEVLLVSDSITPDEREDIKSRLKFYCPNSMLADSTPIMAYFSRKQILLFKRTSLCSHFDKFRFGIYNIDYNTNPYDGWEWSKIAGNCSSSFLDINNSKKRFIKRLNELNQHRLSRCYLFGTGPSLAKAGYRDWSNGYRVVCNTIVKNRALWNHIDPHFIVAGDAIYHFGHTSYARQFRKDLALRLNETDTYFLYPDLFNPIVQLELHDFSEKLLPIPIGNHLQIHKDLTKTYKLPWMGNVLTLLLLPLGCSLSKDIFLWGFDGRAPDDELFWSNSVSESYPDLLESLKKAHPAFFNHHIPTIDPFKYSKEVHGEILERCLTDAEKEGFSFTMMHYSWTSVLQKRGRR